MSLMMSADLHHNLTLFCKRNHIRRLALFGSVLRPDFANDSDIDVLVEFETNHVPGLLGLARLEQALSHLFGGRKVDLNTPGFLSLPMRQAIQTQVVYEAQ